MNFVLSAHLKDAEERLAAFRDTGVDMPALMIDPVLAGESYQDSRRAHPKSPRSEVKLNNNPETAKKPSFRTLPWTGTGIIFFAHFVVDSQANFFAPLGSIVERKIGAKLHNNRILDFMPGGEWLRHTTHHRGSHRQVALAALACRRLDR